MTLSPSIRVRSSSSSSPLLGASSSSQGKGLREGQLRCEDRESLEAVDAGMSSNMAALAKGNTTKSPAPHISISPATLSSTSLSTSTARVPSQRSSTSSSAPEPLFLCTICWQPQFAPSKPQVLGASARIVCHACWKAVLDLSICWVCGECIVRGQEVVSLGWCFWHTGCFGCLICGQRLDVPRDEIEDDRWGDGGWNRGRVRKNKRGVELESVPLCAVCQVETGGEKEEVLVERGLENVSRYDGGLSRDRFEMLGMQEGGRTEKGKRFRVSSGAERELKRFINGNEETKANMLSDSLDAQGDGKGDVPLLANPAALGQSCDMASEEDHSHSDDERCDFGQQEEPGQTVYLSIFDPISEPAFKPSKTKPLPKWMALLPSCVSRDRVRAGKARASISCSSHQLEGLGDNATSEHQHGQTSDETTPRALSRAPTAPMVIPGGLSAARRALTISFDDDFERSGFEKYRLGKLARSHTEESIYMTPPEYSTLIPHPPARAKTPYPESVSSRSMRVTKDRDISNCLEESPLLGDESMEELQAPHNTPEASTRIATRPTPQERPSPLLVQSSEYIDRYAPHGPDLESKYHKYIARDAEKIIEKIKRQKVGGKDMAQIAAETALRRERDALRLRAMKERERNEPMGLDPRREDLCRELRNLFCEE